MSSIEKVEFYNTAHQQFYAEQCSKLRPDCYLRPLIYLVGLSDTTRTHWERIYNEHKREINPDALYEGWQTSVTTNVCQIHVPQCHIMMSS